MTGLRRALALACACAAGAVSAAAVPSSAAAQDEPMTGTSTNRNGTVTLRFTTQYAENRVTLTISRKLARNARRKVFAVECRLDGAYQSTVSILPLSNGQRRLTAPAEPPIGADRCRVKKSGRIVAAMPMRQAAR